jgi:TRAP transporter TAXI family solute receptor
MQKLFNLFLFLVLTSNLAFSQNISIATGGTGGVYYPMGQGLASILSTKVPGFSATAEVTGGSIDNINLISTGRPYIGFSMADAANDARLGIGRFSGKKTDLNTILVLYPNRMHIVTSESSGIRKLQDLRGKRISTGSPRSATEVMALRVLEAASLAPNRDVSTQSYSVAESANAIKEGRIDAFFWVGGLPTAAITDLGNTPGFRLSFIDHAEVVDSINRKYGDLYFSDVIPRTTYPGMTRDSNILSISNVLVTNRSMSEKEIYDIVKAVFDNKNELIRSHYEFTNVTLEGQQSRATPIPFHPGAMKYFKERTGGGQGVSVALRCEAQQVIKFADGGQDCMSSYGFFNQTFDNKKAIMISFANEKGKIAIAFSKDFKACPLSTINWSATSSWALENCNQRIKKIANDEKINPDNCQCETLIEDGVTKFSKQEFGRKIDEYIATRSARLLATNIGPNSSQSIPMNIAPAPNLSTGSLPEKEKVNKLSAQTAKSVYALVIGNGQYKKAGLINPVNDANEIAKRFTQYGFTVKVVFDGDRKTLIKALGDFQAQSVNYETNILFYAGHGIQYNGINYIIPTDMSLEAGSASIDFDAISTNQIVDKYMRGKTKLVFLDACRDNPLARSFVASRGVGSVSKGLAPMDVASGTLISYATKDGNVAADGAGKNSPYTEALLKHLDSREDISLILRKVRQDVMNKTKGQQVPWDYGSLVGGQLILSNK